MTCHHCTGADRFFGAGTARRDLRRLRKKGPSKTTRILIDRLLEKDISGSHVLDVGAGVGGLHLTLLEQGAATATDVDASSAYLAAARDERDRRGLEDRVRYIEGDFLDVVDDVEPADVVCLDRVLCCYPDMERLVASSAGRARHLYGLVFPVDSVWIRPFFLLANAVMAIIRNPFRTFLHDTEAVVDTAQKQGLAKVHHSRSGIWQILVFERPSPSRS